MSLGLQLCGLRNSQPAAIDRHQEPRSRGCLGSQDCFDLTARVGYRLSPKCYGVEKAHDVDAGG
jgi:hypothetical protein